MKIWDKINQRELIKFLIASFVVLLIPIIAYAFKLREDNIWWATFVTQLGIGLIWLFITFGLFREKRHKNKTPVFRSLKMKRLAQEEAQINKSLPKAKINQQKETKKVKSRQGCSLMILTSLIYLIIVLVISYG